MRVMASAARDRTAEKLKTPLAPRTTITAYGGTNWLKKWNAVEEAVGVVVDGRQHAGCLACCLSIRGSDEGLYRRYVSHFTNNTPINSNFAASSTRKQDQTSSQHLRNRHWACESPNRQDVFQPPLLVGAPRLR